MKILTTPCPFTVSLKQHSSANLIALGLTFLYNCQFLTANNLLIYSILCENFSNWFFYKTILIISLLNMFIGD